MLRQAVQSLERRITRLDDFVRLVVRQPSLDSDGAERDAIAKPVALLIPLDLHSERRTRNTGGQAHQIRR